MKKFPSHIFHPICFSPIRATHQGLQAMEGALSALLFNGGFQGGASLIPQSVLAVSPFDWTEFQRRLLESKPGQREALGTGGDTVARMASKSSSGTAAVSAFLSEVLNSPNESVRFPPEDGRRQSKGGYRRTSHALGGGGRVVGRGGVRGGHPPHAPVSEPPGVSADRIRSQVTLYLLYVSKL